MRLIFGEIEWAKGIVLSPGRMADGSGGGGDVYSVWFDGVTSLMCAMEVLLLGPINQSMVLALGVSKCVARLDLPSCVETICKLINEND